MKVLTSVRTWIILPLALQALGRGTSILPVSIHESIPGPIVGQTAPYIFSTLWIISSILLFMSFLGAHDWELMRSESGLVSIRFEDIAILLFVSLTLTWSISYYIEFFNAYNPFTEPPISGAAGRNYLTWGISSFAVWYLLFSTRTRLSLPKNKLPPDKVD